MNKDKQNEAIAKAMGWRPFGKHENVNPSFWFSPLQKNSKELWQTQPIPEYTSDLNAIIQAVRDTFKTDEGKDLYASSLLFIVGFWKTRDLDGHCDDDLFTMATAEAGHHCEAFLRALGLWEDEKPA